MGGKRGLCCSLMLSGLRKERERTADGGAREGQCGHAGPFLSVGGPLGALEEARLCGERGEETEEKRLNLCIKN